MDEPFILLDDARAPASDPAPARLYQRPSEIFRAATVEEVASVLAAAERARRAGAHIAGQIAYEAGLALEPRLAPLAGQTAEPLVWLAAFDDYQEMAPGDVAQWLSDHSSAHGGPPSLSPMRPEIDRAEYDATFANLHEAIAAGDIYQANLTFPLSGKWQGNPIALYAAIRSRAAAGYGGIVHDGADWTLTFSPELFFALRDGLVTLRPMKGTRPRGTNPAQDSELAARLRDSAKDRAENLMITDLMRNDVSRVAVPGSVRVENPFAIETYPTVHQMVTTIRARLAPRHDAMDLIRAIFPCGSITGVPKIRAMELIDAVENHPRGIYCGGVGRLDPNGDAAFNVAIRTLRLSGHSSSHGGTARLGVGSAIVADSTARQEWEECLLKGEFVAQTTPDYDLIETMAFDPSIGVPYIEYHLERLKHSAAQLGFECDRHALRNDIQAFCFTHREPERLRIALHFDGSWDLEGSPMPDAMPDPAPVAIVPLTVSGEDWRLRHKTSLRDFYNEALDQARSAGAVEAILVRPDGFVTEGSFSNIFVRRGDMLLTPPLSRGLLPGVLRRHLIEEGLAKEADLTVEDLAEGLHIGNALRGLIKAKLL